ncbi:MAG: fibronectin type III-like domain-contianing protein [Oscillospiraceae bacterium]|nr:fibronectin type III-like domain-contianing protein [Oscillospiraceae bacterium]
MKVYAYERDHLAALRKQNAGCTLFLRRNGDFPLAGPGQIALYGSGARRTVKGGTGSGEVNSRFFTTVEQGLADAGFTVTTGDWLDGYDVAYARARKKFHWEVKRRAWARRTLSMIDAWGAVMPEPEYRLPLEGEGGTAVYVLSRISGEGSDRAPVEGDILLTQAERRDILSLRRRYQRFLLVLNTGGPVDLSPVMDVENILLLGQLGVETGAVLADIILGRSCPSGKLAATWSAWEDYCHIGDECGQDDTRYREGIYVGYRYFDSVGKRALFPFGYGLGYTDFSMEAGEVSVEGGVVTARAAVTNTGAFAGREVVQVYVSVPAGKLDEPYQELAGFVKTRELRPGETETAEVRFSLADLAGYDEENACWLLERGGYTVRVGNSSVDTVAAAVLRLERDVVTWKVKNACGKPDFTDWKPESPRDHAVPDGTPVIDVAPESIATAAAVYGQEYPVDDFIRGLSDEELCTVNTGSFDPKGGVASIIGSASSSVAGAAGETTSILKDKGFPALVMADGPAGLRLSKVFYRDEKGAHAVGTAVQESFLEFLPGAARWVMSRAARPPKGVVLRPQYATAIPAGASIAQSWDLAFARMCGDIVGDEMVRFGVHLWLAPALNIHRSIRCGRNFEYFSEDPLLSGRFAAAMTQGVQSHPGCGVTIKHYCANNQETNRYNNNSMVSERAMREIYLKGFGICVKESQPAAAMTSYNLLNGVHTSQRRDIIDDVLRSEFGFQGIVMTDWIAGGSFLSKSSRYPAPHAGLVAAAGGDLFMPGCRKDLMECMGLLRSGGLSRRQLEINATRVYRLCKKLNGQ